MGILRDLVMNAIRSKKKKPEQMKTVIQPKLKPKRWCVLFGFKRDNHSETGCLAFRTSDEIKANPHIGIYKIVDDASDAKHFPCENYDNIKGFASPEKWLKFFSEEPELKDWKFHLLKMTSTNEMPVEDSRDKDKNTSKEDERMEICG